MFGLGSHASTLVARVCSFGARYVCMRVCLITYRKNTRSPTNARIPFTIKHILEFTHGRSVMDGTLGSPPLPNYPGNNVTPWLLGLVAIGTSMLWSSREWTKVMFGLGSHTSTLVTRICPFVARYACKHASSHIAWTLVYLQLHTCPPTVKCIPEFKHDRNVTKGISGRPVLMGRFILQHKIAYPN